MLCSEDKSINDKILAFVVRKAENQLLCFCFETQSPVSDQLNLSFFLVGIY